jgi:hypothetical protein
MRKVPQASAVLVALGLVACGGSGTSDDDGAAGAAGNAAGGHGGTLGGGGAGGTGGGSGAAAGGAGGVAGTSGAAGSSAGGAGATGGRAGAGAVGGSAGAMGGRAGAGAMGGSAGATGGRAGAGAMGGRAGAGASGGGGASQPGTFSEVWDFTADAEGWTEGFCDYPPDTGTGYELTFGWASLPADLPAGGGLRIGGNNHSDDLFMYLTHAITGLRPNAAYLMDVVLLIGTNAPTDCGGIGGSPGTSVFMKIGGAATAPQSQKDNLGFLRLNLDKGNQSVGGADLKVVGHIGNTLPCVTGSPPYQAKTLTLSSFPITSSSDGTVFAVVGTDSGFEGVTTLFYDRIAITLTPAN